MTKGELIRALEPYTDDIELWMEADGLSMAPVGGATYDPKGPYDRDEAVLVFYPGE